MWRETNMYGVLRNDNNEYKLYPHIEIECTEGEIEVTTYEPHAVTHKYNTDTEIVIRNETNKQQVIRSTGVIGPRSKSDLTILCIRPGRTKETMNKDRQDNEKDATK